MIFFLFSYRVHAEDLKSFLSSCGYGTLIGTGVGLASLVFEKKPNESYVNIARGASLGLYAGIGVGLYNLNNPSKEVTFSIVPNLNSGLMGFLSWNY